MLICITQRLCMLRIGSAYPSSLRTSHLAVACDASPRKFLTMASFLPSRINLRHALQAMSHTFRPLHRQSRPQSHDAYYSSVSCPMLPARPLQLPVLIELSLRAEPSLELLERYSGCPCSAALLCTIPCWSPGAVHYCLTASSCQPQAIVVMY